MDRILLKRFETSHPTTIPSPDQPSYDPFPETAVSSTEYDAQPTGNQARIGTPSVPDLRVGGQQVSQQLSHKTSQNVTPSSPRHMCSAPNVVRLVSHNEEHQPPWRILDFFRSESLGRLYHTNRRTLLKTRTFHTPILITSAYNSLVLSNTDNHTISLGTALRKNTLPTETESSAVANQICKRIHTAYEPPMPCR